MSLTHEQARALIIEREQAKAQAEAQPLQQALAEVERLRTLLGNARTVINQFLPNVGHCFGIDAQLLNETLIAIGTVVAVDPGQPGGDMTATAIFHRHDGRLCVERIEHSEPPCSFCFQRGCNGECHGDDMMGDS